MKRYRRLEPANTKPTERRRPRSVARSDDPGLSAALRQVGAAYAAGVQRDRVALRRMYRRSSVEFTRAYRKLAARLGHTNARTRERTRQWWADEGRHLPERVRRDYGEPAKQRLGVAREHGGVALHRYRDGLQRDSAQLSQRWGVAREQGGVALHRYRDGLQRDWEQLSQWLGRARVQGGLALQSYRAGLQRDSTQLSRWLQPRLMGLNDGVRDGVAGLGRRARRRWRRSITRMRAASRQEQRTDRWMEARGVSPAPPPWARPTKQNGHENGHDTEHIDFPPPMPFPKRPAKRTGMHISTRSARIKRFMGLGAVLGVGLLALAAASGAVVYTSIASEFVPPEEMAINEPAGGATILDRDGRLLYRYIDETTGLRDPVSSLDEVSPHLLAVTIATEDHNFYSNPGINSKGLTRAAWENLSPFSGELLEGSGGSSITQQLVKRVYFDPSEQASRSLDRKAREVIFALKLNSQYEKEEILAWYLNEISYGGVFFGIEAASRGYFDKPASDLTLAEAALLAGIPQSPAVYDPRTNPEAARDRRNQVLDLLAEHERVRVREHEEYSVDLRAIEAAKRSPIELAPPKQHVINAPHFVFTYLQPELEAAFGKEALLKDGLTITTTLDLELQREAERILEHWITEFEDSNTHNGAAVVIDPRTGELLAMVGSRDYGRIDIEGQNNNLLVPNSPGSAFKPFVYLGLLLKDGTGPGRPIDDSPLRHEQPDGSVFEPENPTGRNHGWVSVRDALGNSLNVTAFRAAEEVGVPQVVDLGKRAGLTTLDGTYGPAIAIGGVDVKPLDLAFAYTVLANGGVMRGQPAVIPHEEDERKIDPISVLDVTRQDGTSAFDAQSRRTEQQIFPEQHVFMINSILTDPNAQCMTFGCGGLNVPDYQVAVKTGTSEPFDPEGPDAGKIGETWAFGYTPDVVVGIWAGNADNAPITNITSTSIAFRSMRDLLLAYYDGRPGSTFEPPPGVVQRHVCFLRPARMCTNDWFLEESLQALSPAPAEPAPPAPVEPAPPAPSQPERPAPPNASAGIGVQEPQQQGPPDDQRERVVPRSREVPEPLTRPPWRNGRGRD